MREALKQINKVRARFRATVSGFGQRSSYGHPKPMVLLVNVRDEHGRQMTDHVWFDRRKWVDDLNLQPGDEIEFDARVGSYSKGYADERRIDYKLMAKMDKTNSGFEVGDRVTMSNLAMRQGMDGRMHRRDGYVVRICRDPYCIAVRRDGRQQPEIYAVEFWVKVE